MMNRKLLALTTLAGVLGVGAATQVSAADWLVRVGAHSVNPKSNNHAVVNVDEGESLTFNFTYFLTENWGLELLAAAPFKHDINLNTGGRVAEATHLPPTLSIQYHFLPDARFRPYVGVGLNYTNFFDEKTKGALAGTALSLDNSFGAAAQIGADFAINDVWFVNVDVRWMDIDTDARLGGASIGSVAIDPVAFGISIGRKFSW